MSRAVQCRVCNDARRGYVDSLIAGGRSMKSIEAETGLPYDSIRRHVANHVPKAAKPAAPSVALPAGASPYDTMRKRVDDLNAMDSTTMSTRDRIAHSEELRRAAETLAKLTPVDPTAGTVRVDDIEGLPEFFAVIFGLLSRPITAPDGADSATVERYRGRAMEREDTRRAVAEAMRQMGLPTEPEEAA